MLCKALSTVRRLLAVGLLFGVGILRAEPPAGPALGLDFFRSPSEPPGPSSRRAGIVISEIMYHPAANKDGLSGQFIEVFNSQAWFEDLSGWRISGDVDFTFPTNFTLPSRGYAIIAANPAEFTQLTGLTNVLGPFTGSLPNGKGTLRLRHRSGAVQFEVEYRDDGPWPAAADGAGPSLVLARPSWGEHDPHAWTASERVGGSPGEAEPARDTALRSIVINELLAHTDPPQVDFIELFNYSDAAVDLVGCVLTDDPDKAKYVMPTNTVIPARGFLAFAQADLGFALNAAGETVILRSPDRSRVLDSVRFGAQENGVSLGRYPDGATALQRLESVTQGEANARVRPSAVVINEIMYHPPTEDSADEYIELHNPGATPVDLSGWRLEDAVSFQFAPGTQLAAGGYFVVAKAAAHLRTNYPALNPANLFGDFSGTLADGGERVALSFPDQITSTNSAGGVVTNTIHIVLDEVTYGTGGRWGRWSDGGGSSLELRDPHADRRSAANWADSNESAKSPWVTVAATGIADNGNQTANGLELFLYGPGEALVDNVEVIGAGGTNLLLNADFEAMGTTNWVFQGNHGASSLENTEGFQSQRSLHVRATGPGHTGPNRIRVPLRATVSNGQTTTIRAKVRWLAGSGNIHFRLHGNWHEAPGYIIAAHNLGTPGAPNSQRVANAGPAIYDVAHWPVLPTVSQPVLVTARANDPDGLASLTLRWRRDPATNYTDVEMQDNGSGLFSATIPAPGVAGIGAFYVMAKDGAATPATASFPADAPTRECLVRWGETLVPGLLGNYRLWMTKTNIDRWTRREKLSNDPLDGTFVYGNFRVIYNAGGQYSGSPYHAPSYTSPTAGNCDYVFVFPNDDSFLAETEISLLQPGNGGGDSTCQQEKHAYWIAEQLGLPFCNRRPVVLVLNGVRRGQVYDDAQQPTRDYVKQWFPDDSDGELRKIQLWFEFDNSGSSFDPVSANLARYLSGGSLKRARYRWNWPLRGFGNDPNNYTNLFRLVEQVNTPISGDTYTRTLLYATDVDKWFRTHVTEHIVGNNDSYSYGGGQNMYAYKPRNGPWELLIWDIDFAFAAGAPTSDMFGIGGQNVGPVNTHAPFARMYWQVLIDSVSDPLLPERSNPIIDARYNGMRTSAGSVAVGSGIKSFVASRRTYINQMITNRNAKLAFTLNGGASFDTPNSYITLTGTAPLNAKTLTLNGSPLDVRWTSITNWTATVALIPGTNSFTLAGLNSRGEVITNAPAQLAVNYTAVPELPEGRVIISEVHHHPVLPGSAFVELRNVSTTTAFDLGGWRIEGIDFTFAPGTVLPPGSQVVVVEDAYAFATAFGPTLRPAGVYAGKLSGAGETLRLFRPTADGKSEMLVDQFTFETGTPWPTAALTGGSLQLIDPTKDNNRPANWTAVGTDGSPGPQWQRVVATGTASSSALYLYLENSAGEVYVDDLKLVAGSDPDSGANLIANGDFESPLSGPWVVAANHSESALSSSVFFSGKSSLRMIASSGGTTRDSAIVQDITPALVTDQTYTLSFWYRPVTTSATLTVRLSGNGIRASTSLAPPAAMSRATPGTLNSANATLPAWPPVWLNEVQTENLGGPSDNAGQREPWVELFNGGPTPASLAGCYLGSTFDNLLAWPFPAEATIPAGGTLLVWLDGQPGQTTSAQLHAGFRAAAESGIITLTQVAGGRTNLLDYLRYVSPGPDRSVGDFPDGDLSSRHVFALPTPRALNTLAAPAFNVFINEWMADNTATVADPADGNFKDWFELFNAGSTPANLSGLYLGTSLADRFKFQIPAGYVIPARGSLLVWADKKIDLNIPANADLHADFKLSAEGEGITLVAADGTVIDAVTFGPQQPDVSEGRAPDGGLIAGVLPVATPHAVNSVPPPTVVGIGADAEVITVTWSAFPGARYQLEATDGLEFPNWQPAGDPVTATVRTASTVEALRDQTGRFFRVRLLE